MDASAASRRGSGSQEPWVSHPGPFRESPTTRLWKSLVSTRSLRFFPLMLSDCALGFPSFLVILRLQAGGHAALQEGCGRVGLGQRRHCLPRGRAEMVLCGLGLSQWLGSPCGVGGGGKGGFPVNAPLGHCVKSIPTWAELYLRKFTVEKNICYSHIVLLDKTFYCKTVVHNPPEHL